MSYSNQILTMLKQQNANQKEFIQAATEVLQSIELVVKKDKIYQKNAVLERLIEPDRTISFKVPWIDRDGFTKVNRGYRIQFNNAIGPYKGGLRFHKTVNTSILKFLGFEQIFKNSLTGLPIGGAKGGSNFDPHDKTESEIQSFCTSFMIELQKYIGADIDVPAGDIGVGSREIGYLYGAYKRIKNLHTGTLTGKGLEYGGSNVRKEATGYGLLYIVNEYLKDKGHSIKGKKVSISGSGNVAIYAAEKAIQLGCIVVAMSDSNGFVHDPSGIDLHTIKDIKEIKRERLSIYTNYKSKSEYIDRGNIWDVPVEIALPCATQNELDIKNAKTLRDNGVLIVAEGANMPTSADAINLLLKDNIGFIPGKAANAGGVATSGFEMSQNSMRQIWTFEQVDKYLQQTMKEVYYNISKTAKEYNNEGNFVIGSNIFGFLKVASAMIAQGI